MLQNTQQKMGRGRRGRTPAYYQQRNNPIVFKPIFNIGTGHQKPQTPTSTIESKLTPIEIDYLRAQTQALSVIVNQQTAEILRLNEIIFDLNERLYGPKLQKKIHDVKLFYCFFVYMLFLFLFYLK